MDRAAFNRSILDDTAHRPWPMPEGSWVMTQTWHDLLFAHWPVDAETLRALVPAIFELDRFDGATWLGIVPFHMTNVTPRLVPALPWVSAFPEFNVRTYVTVDGKPGVFFFSLDAGNPLAVGAARALLNLPYFSATMKTGERDGRVDYASRRHSAPARIHGALSRPGRSGATAPRHARVLPDRTLLPVCRRPRVPPVPARHSPPGLAARVGRGGDRGEYDGRRRGPAAPADGTAAAFLQAAGYGLLGAGAASPIVCVVCSSVVCSCENRWA